MHSLCQYNYYFSGAEEFTYNALGLIRVPKIEFSKEKFMPYENNIYI